MSANEASASDEPFGDAPLELVTDDEEYWTAVPVDATGDERASEWITVDVESLCDLASWR